MTTRADALQTLRRVMFASKSLSEVRRAANALLRYDAAQSAAAAKSLTAAKAATPPPPKPQELTVKQLIAESLKSVTELEARAKAASSPPSPHLPTPSPAHLPKPTLAAA